MDTFDKELNALTTTPIVSLEDIVSIFQTTTTNSICLTPNNGYWTYDYPRSRPTNCKNCGAPLHGDKCEYCGSEY